MYADYDFYKSEYGGSKIESESLFDYYANKATAFMNFITRRKLVDNLPSDEDDLNTVKSCCCLLADCYKDISDIKDSMSSVSGGGTITSMSSGGESISMQPSALQTAVASGDKEIHKFLLDEANIYLSGLADDDGYYYLYWGI